VEHCGIDLHLKSSEVRVLDEAGVVRETAHSDDRGKPAALVRWSGGDGDLSGGWWAVGVGQTAWEKAFQEPGLVGWVLAQKRVANP
jgi:hypothetical protein